MFVVDKSEYCVEQGTQRHILAWALQYAIGTGAPRVMRSGKLSYILEALGIAREFTWVTVANCVVRCMLYCREEVASSRAQNQLRKIRKYDLEMLSRQKK